MEGANAHFNALKVDVTRLSRKYEFKVVVVTADNSRDDVIQATLKKLHVKTPIAGDYMLVAEAENKLLPEGKEMFELEVNESPLETYLSYPKGGIRFILKPRNGGRVRRRSDDKKAKSFDLKPSSTMVTTETAPTSAGKVRTEDLIDFSSPAPDVKPKIASSFSSSSSLRHSSHSLHNISLHNSQPNSQPNSQNNSQPHSRQNSQPTSRQNSQSESLSRSESFTALPTTANPVVVQNGHRNAQDKMDKMDRLRHSFTSNRDILPDQNKVYTQKTPQQQQTMSSTSSSRKHSQEDMYSPVRESPHYKGESPSARGSSTNSGQTTPGSVGGSKNQRILTPGHQQALERMRRGLEKLRRQPTGDEQAEIPGKPEFKPVKFVDRQSLEYMKHQQQEEGGGGGMASGRGSRGVVRTPQQELVKQGVMLPAPEEFGSGSGTTMKDRGGHILYHPQPVHPRRASLESGKTTDITAAGFGAGAISQSPYSPVSSSAHSDGYISRGGRRDRDNSVGEGGDASAFVRRTHSFTNNPTTAFTPPEMTKSRSLQSLRSVQRRRSLPPLQVSREHLEEKKTSISQRLAKKINKYKEEGQRAILPSTFSSQTLQFLKDFNVLTRRTDPEADEAMSLPSMEVAQILEGKAAQPTTKEVEEYLECVEADPNEKPKPKPKPKLQKSESLKSIKTMSKIVSNGNGADSFSNNIPATTNPKPKKGPVMGTSLPRNNDNQVEIVYDEDPPLPPPPMFSQDSNVQDPADQECFYNDVANNNTIMKRHHSFSNTKSGSKDMGEFGFLKDRVNGSGSKEGFELSGLSKKSSSYHCLTAVDIPLDIIENDVEAAKQLAPKLRGNVPQTNGFIKRRHSLHQQQQQTNNFTTNSTHAQQEDATRNNNSNHTSSNNHQQQQQPTAATLFHILRTHTLFTVRLEKGSVFKSFGILVTQVNFGLGGGGMDEGQGQSVVAVGNVIDGGPASTSVEGEEKPAPGDLIIEVNGHNVLQSSDKAVRTLLDARSSLELVVARPKHLISGQLASSGQPKASPTKLPSPTSSSAAAASHGKILTSPGQLRKSTGQLQTSPGQLRKSTGQLQTSPGQLRKSTGQLQRSPGQPRKLLSLQQQGNSARLSSGQPANTSLPGQLGASSSSSSSTSKPTRIPQHNNTSSLVEYQDQPAPLDTYNIC